MPQSKTKLLHVRRQEPHGTPSASQVRVPVCAWVSGACVRACVRARARVHCCSVCGRAGELLAWAVARQPPHVRCSRSSRCSTPARSSPSLGYHLRVQPQQQVVLDAVAADRVYCSATRQRRRKVLLQPLEVAVAQQQRVESAARAQQQPEAVDVPVPRQRRLGAALPVPWGELRRWASLCRLPPEKERLQPAALVPPSAAAARCRQRRQRRQGLVRSAGEL